MDTKSASNIISIGSCNMVLFNLLCHVEGKRCTDGSKYIPILNFWVFCLVLKAYSSGSIGYYDHKPINYQFAIV